MAEKKQIPIVEGLFTWPSAATQLIGGRCTNCKSVFFPQSYQVHRPDCEQSNIEEVLFSRKGILRSFTTQNYPAPVPFRGPDPFIPYAIGMVEFPEGVQIYGIMTGCIIEDLKMNMEVEVVAEELYEDEQGNSMLTWKFRPV